MGWRKKGAIAAGILIVLYTLAGFFVIPMAAESILPQKIAEHLDRPASVENISFNPYTLALSVEDLEILEKTGEERFVSFDLFYANFQWESLFRLAPVTSEMSLDNPFIRIARVSEAEFNFSDLIPEEKPESDSPEEKEKDEPFRFSMSDMKLSDGTVVFRDEPMDKTHRFSGINFKLPALSNFEAEIDVFSEPLLSGSINESELRVDASTKPFADSLETVLDISIAGISLPAYFDYAPWPLDFKVTGGTLEIDSSVAFRHQPDQEKNWLEVSGTADFSGLKIEEAGGPQILSVPSAKISIAPSNPLEKKLRIRRFSLNKPEITVARRTNGDINLADLVPFQKKKEENETREPEEKEPFVLEMEIFQLESGRAVFRDFAAPSASESPNAGPTEISMEAINLEVSDFSNSAGSKAELDFSAGLDHGGSVSAEGNFGAVPLGGDLNIDISSLDLTRAQLYFPDELHLLLSQGTFGLTGNAGFKNDPDKGFSAVYKGDAEISDLVLTEEKTGRQMTGLKSLALSEIEASWNPARINIAEISADGLKQQTVVEKDGSLNITGIYDKKPSPEKQEKQQQQQQKNENGQNGGGIALPVAIGEISLSDISLSFTDNSTSQEVSSLVTLKEGSVKGLSTDAFDGADLVLRGAVDRHAPFYASGRINPLLETLLLDLDFKLENLELSPFSVYSGKYAGRAIKKGKLNLDLEYLVENRKLEAENRITLDQFRLGKHVESDSATNLPVGMAVALLKDRKGKIDIDLPVSGRTDDPEFRLTGIIINSLVNIIARAATSPFSLVSSLIGGGEELRYIEFDPGSSRITDTAAEKLESIQTLLYERPEVKLELTGYTDIEKDRKALAAMKLEEKIRQEAVKARENSSGSDKEKAEKPELTEDDYEKYLRKIYEQEVLSGPEADREAKPLSDESLTAAEMKEKIRQTITTEDSELRLLAQNRMKAAKSFILKDDRIESSRLFLREPESLTPDKPGKFSSCRVELDLR